MFAVSYSFYFYLFLLFDCNWVYIVINNHKKKKKTKEGSAKKIKGELNIIQKAIKNNKRARIIVKTILDKSDI